VDRAANEAVGTNASGWKGVLTMYIGGGMIVFILIVLVVVFLVRR
jgi:flagellar biogenesis protein FliO